MLKRKRGFTACSLSSCRITAEALARAFNSRIWQCTWVDHRRRAGDSEEEDEEYFEASPVEDGDGDLSRQGRDSSAATVEGRAKLYKLLQQHVTDDAIEVFYDVSEHAEHDVENAGQSLPGIEDGFEEVKLNDSNDSAGSSNDVISVIDENINAETSLVESTTSGGDIPPVHSESGNSPPVIAMKNYPDGGLISSEVNDGLKNSLFENEEILSVTVELDSHQIECHQVDVADSSIHENHIRESCDSSEDKSERLDQQDEQNCGGVSSNDEVDVAHSSTQENHIGELGDSSEVKSERLDQQDEQNCGRVSSTDAGDSVSIKITETCKSASEANNDEHLSANDANDKCRLKAFNEIRPLISRSTSLKTGKTPPGTPSRKKIVRFADVLGLDLEDVRHIISGDLPNVPSSAYSDLVLPDGDLPTQSPPSVTLELKGRQQGAWESVQQSAVSPNAIYPQFAIPGQQPDFMDKVRSLGVCLESVIISDFNVQCTCRVMNWGFNKKVVARYTGDGWKSSSDINASYVSDSTRDGTDSFAFNIYLSQHRCNVEFALRYQVNDKEYWDNNGGRNYCLGYHGNSNIGQSAVPISPTWMSMHQFW